MRRAEMSVFYKDMETHTVLVNDILRERIFPKISHVDTFFLEDDHTFFNLIWHYSSYTSILTPPYFWGGGKLYTVLEVARFMIEKGYTFEMLSRGEVKGAYALDWFLQCDRIYRSLDTAKFGPFLLAKANYFETFRCPDSLFKIIDGMHRSLVLSYMLLKREIEYFPIQVYLLYF